VAGLVASHRRGTGHAVSPPDWPGHGAARAGQRPVRRGVAGAGTGRPGLHLAGDAWPEFPHLRV